MAVGQLRHVHEGNKIGHRLEAAMTSSKPQVGGNDSGQTRVLYLTKSNRGLYGGIYGNSRPPP